MERKVQTRKFSVRKGHFPQNSQAFFMSGRGSIIAMGNVVSNFFHFKSVDFTSKEEKERREEGKKGRREEGKRKEEEKRRERKTSFFFPPQAFENAPSKRE